jgi:hypothetical protein
MPWVEGDRLRIADALLLMSVVDRPTSMLQSLMTRLESQSPTRIEQIQDLLDKIEAIKEAHENGDDSALELGIIKSQDSYLEGSVTYQDNLKAILDEDRLERSRRFRQRIRRWLDPYNYLARYSGVGRAVDGT